MNRFFLMFFLEERYDDFQAISACCTTIRTISTSHYFPSGYKTFSTRERFWFRSQKAQQAFPKHSFRNVAFPHDKNGNPKKKKKNTHLRLSTCISVSPLPSSASPPPSPNAPKPTKGAPPPAGQVALHAGWGEQNRSTMTDMTKTMIHDDDNDEK